MNKETKYLEFTNNVPFLNAYNKSPESLCVDVYKHSDGIIDFVFLDNDKEQNILCKIQSPFLIEVLKQHLLMFPE